MTPTPPATRRIPIENLYYLLCYACDRAPTTGELQMDPEDCPDALNLLARALARSLRNLSRHGLERSYVVHEEATPRLRGRILVAESQRRMLDRQARMICRFDEFSADWLPNQILRGTCDRLLRGGGLEKNIRGELRAARECLAGVSPIRVMNAHFGQVRFHRNNRAYRLPLAVCRMLHRILMPSERDGSSRFHDPLQDEKVMPRLFEQFVQNFAEFHLPEAKVRGQMRIQWDGSWNEETEEVLPKMFVDVVVEHPDRRLLIDCKFYREALETTQYGRRFHSAHLYQLLSYLRNQSVVSDYWKDVQGLLLYPAVDHHLDYYFELNGHHLRVASIDLDRPWKEIHDSLLAICREGSTILPN